MSDPNPTPQPAETLSGLNRLFDRALRALGDAGHVDEACRLAADGWSLLRRAAPREAERLNGTLHWLTRPRPQPGRVSAAGGGGAPGVLDVRDLPPAERHEQIFETYHALKPGEAFELINDHDPKPLYYQFAAEHPEAFTWETLAAGPRVWRVRIGRRGPGPA